MAGKDRFGVFCQRLTLCQIIQHLSDGCGQGVGRFQHLNTISLAEHGDQQFEVPHFQQVVSPWIVDYINLENQPQK